VRFSETHTHIRGETMSGPAPFDPNAYRPLRVSGMAVTAMVLSIIGVATSCLLIGFPIVIIGIILGIVALSQINRRPQELAGKGYALAAIITGAAGGFLMIPLAIAILLPSLGRARELSNRAYCAANLRGIVQSMNIYANDNADTFPVVMPAPAPGTYTFAQGLAGNTNTTVDPSLNLMYDKSTRAAAGSVTACWWVLVLKNQVSPRQFICKSDPVATSTPAAISNAANVFNLDFQDATQFSYSSAYPWNAAAGSPMPVGGWWKSVTDSSLPIMADMAPENGTGSNPIEATAGYGIGPAGGNTRSWNSNNHQRDGQNVGFSDAHVEFTRRPDVGPNNDNIWTHNGTGGPAQNGTPISAGTVTSRYGFGPAARGVEAGGPPGFPPGILIGGGPFDVVMVPIADVSTGRRK
jgi:hypothetical protein